MREPTMLHRLAAEFIGTFWLVFGGCGSAVFAAKFTSDGTSLGIGFLGVALAFGLTVLTGVYAFGTISGGHFNPAVTLGAALARRVEWKALPGYWITQVIAGLVAGMMIYVDRQGPGGLDRDRPHGRQRFWRTLPRRLLAVGGDRRRGGPHRSVPVGHPRLNRRPRTKRLRGLGDWPDLDADPPDLDPDLEHVGQPGAVHRRRVLQRRRRAGAAVGVLAGAVGGRRDRGHRLPIPVRPQRGTRRPAGARRRPGGAAATT